MILTLQEKTSSLVHSLHPMNVAGVSQSTIDAKPDANGPDVLAIVTMIDGSQFIASASYRDAMEKWTKALRSWLPGVSTAF